MDGIAAFGERFDDDRAIRARLIQDWNRAVDVFVGACVDVVRIVTRTASHRILTSRTGNQDLASVEGIGASHAFQDIGTRVAAHNIVAGIAHPAQRHAPR